MEGVRDQGTRGEHEVMREGRSARGFRGVHKSTRYLLLLSFSKTLG